MKLRIILLILVIIIVLSLGFLFSLYSDKNEKQSKFPLITFTSIHGKQINLESVTKAEGFCFSILSTDCDVCQSEAILISQIKKLYPDYYFIVLLTDSLNEIRTFDFLYKLEDKNVIIGYISSDSLMKYWGNISIPHIFIYNKEKSLIFNEPAINMNTFKKYWKATS